MKSFIRLNGKLVSYEGMSEETIATMLAEQGLTLEFIDEETYSSELKILQDAMEKK
jgi:hypothetical protein